MFCDMVIYPMALRHPEDGDYEDLKRRMRIHFQHCVVRYEETLPLLLRSGANIDAENNEGLTPLICCIKARFSIRLTVDYDKPVQILVEHGAKFRTSTGKHAISYVKSVSFAGFFLDKDSSEINMLDDQGWTPLHQIMAQSTSEYIPMIMLLLQRGAVIEDGAHIVDIARKQQFSFEFMEYLLEGSLYDINTPDEDGATLLMQYGNTTEIIDKLLGLGADIKLVDNKGRSAWCNIWSIEHPAAAKKLIDAGVDASTEKEIISVLMGHYCRLSTLYSPKSEQWFDIIKHVLNLPKVQSPAMLKNILSTVKAGVLGRNAFDKTRYFRVLKYIVETHGEIVTFLLESPVYCHAASLQFQNTQLDPIGWILAFTGMLYHDNYPIDEYICSLLDVGFQVVRTPASQVSALSALLTIPRGTRDCDFRVVNLAKIFIQRGVNVESCALKYQPEQRALQASKDGYQLPDALLLAFLNNRVDIVMKLLSYWWAPPLALLLFKPQISEQELATWFKRLDKYPGVPQGTQLFTLVSSKIQTADQETRTAFNNKHGEMCLFLFIILKHKSS